MDFNFLLLFIAHFIIVWIVGSVYFHRGIAHSMLEFSKPAEHVFRFILWTVSLLTSPGTLKFMAAEHRFHHKYSDGPKDYTSPQNKKFKEIFFPNKKPFSWDDVEKYAPDVPLKEDWIQFNVYKKYKKGGMIFIAGLYGLLFGIEYAILGYLLTMLIPISMPVIGDFGFHLIGYRNEPGRNNDQSHNLLPVGFILGGEELHANHHNYPGKINFGIKWFEVDVIYYFIILLSKLNLVTIKAKSR